MEGNSEELALCLMSQLPKWLNVAVTLAELSCSILILQGTLSSSPVVDPRAGRRRPEHISGV